MPGQANFLKAWGCNRTGELWANNEDQKPLYIWTGKFICGETVVIATDAASTKRIGEASRDFYVGVMKESDYESETKLGRSALQVSVEAADYPARGISSAIALLSNLAGPPTRK